MKFTREFSRFLLLFVPYSVLLYFLLLFFEKEIFPEHDFYFSSLSICCFLSVLTAVICLVTTYIHKIAPHKSGFAFLGLSILKMLVSVVFLLPLITWETENKVPSVLFFFIPFFLTLFVEVLFLIGVVGRQ